MSHQLIGAFFVLLTLGLFVLMVKLGFWQLSRAEQKQRWQAELSARMSNTLLNFSELTQLAKQDDNPTGYRFSLKAKAIENRIILLDNQTYQGDVGYLAFQMLEVMPDRPWILLELGFVKAAKERSILPNIQGLVGEYQLTGRLYRRELNPLSQNLMPEQEWPMRIQNINLPQLQQKIGHKLMPFVLQPDTLSGIDFPHPWQPIPMPAKKHFGYALQWFSMAGALAILTMIFIFKQRCSTRKHKSTA